jgi:hypothetical protein
MLWLCPAFWHLDTNIYLVFSGFTSRPTSLQLVTTDLENYKGRDLDDLKRHNVHTTFRDDVSIGVKCMGAHTDSIVIS